MKNVRNDYMWLYWRMMGGALFLCVLVLGSCRSGEESTSAPPVEQASDSLVWSVALGPVFHEKKSATVVECTARDGCLVLVSTPGESDVDRMHVSQIGPNGQLLAEHGWEEGGNFEWRIQRVGETWLLAGLPVAGMSDGGASGSGPYAAKFVWLGSDLIPVARKELVTTHPLVSYAATDTNTIMGVLGGQGSVKSTGEELAVSGTILFTASGRQKLDAKDARTWTARLSLMCYDGPGYWVAGSFSDVLHYDGEEVLPEYAEMRDKGFVSLIDRGENVRWARLVRTKPVGGAQPAQKSEPMDLVADPAGYVWVLWHEPGLRTTDNGTKGVAMFDAQGVLMKNFRLPVSFSGTRPATLELMRNGHIGVLGWRLPQGVQDGERADETLVYVEINRNGDLVGQAEFALRENPQLLNAAQSDGALLTLRRAPGGGSTGAQADTATSLLFERRVLRLQK